MATQTSKWVDAGVEPVPTSDATYIVDEQPIAEYDNWFNFSVVTDVGVLFAFLNAYDANTILKADSDNTPVALTIDEGDLVGRKAGGSIDALNATDVRTMLDVADGADVTGSNPPQTHNTSHQSAGGDAIKLDDLATPDDNIDLNSSATYHGLCPKLSNDAGQYLTGVGTWTAPSGSGDMLKSVYDPDLNGVIAVAQGGTGVTNDTYDADKVDGCDAGTSTGDVYEIPTLAHGSVLYADVAGAIVERSPGTDGYVLTTHAGGGAPTWSAPSAGGDMLKAVYDANDDGIIAVAQTEADVTADNAPKAHNQTASTISDFDTEVANNTAVTANTAKVTNATHTGEVTGSGVLTIAADAVTYAKMQNVAADERILGRVSGADGVVEELTKTQVLALLNVTDGAEVNLFEEATNVLREKSSGGYDNDFVIGSPQLDDDTNAAHDARMFFDKTKGAFRVGIVTGAEWNGANVGAQSHAEGYNTIASAEQSHAEGYNTIASAGQSHAEGYNTIASGARSHAEGYYTTASAGQSHAEGYYTTASGAQSHAEGYDTTASAERSHAEGYDTTASGVRSHAEGDSSNAYLYSQHAKASGKFTAFGDAQLSNLVARIGTTDASPAVETFLNGSSKRAVLPANRTWKFTIDIAARQTGGTAGTVGDSGIYKIEGGIKRDGANNTALIGAITKTVLAEDQAGWDVTAVADDTNEALVVKVTGEANKTIHWVAAINLVEVG